MNIRIRRRLPAIALLAVVAIALSLLGQAGPTTRVSAQANGTDTPTVTGTPATATATATGTTVAEATATSTVAAGATSTGTAVAGATATGTAVAGATATSTTTTPPVTLTAFCGTVTSYTGGTLTLSGPNSNQTFIIPNGVTLTNSQLLLTGTNVCVQFTLTSSGQIASGTVSANSSTQFTVCGTLTAFAPAGTSTTGTLSIAGINFTIASGVGFTGSLNLNQLQTLVVTTNGLGYITSGTVTTATCTTPTITAPYSAFTAATATTAGSITIGGVTYTIAAGSALTAVRTVPLAAHVVNYLRPAPSRGRAAIE